MKTITTLAVTAVLLSACSEKKKAPEPAAQPVAAPAPAPMPPPGPTEPVEPCSLFPKEDAEAILGTPVDNPVSQSHSEGAILSCSYPEAAKAPDPKAAKKEKKGVRQPGVDAAVPVVTYMAQSAKRVGTANAAAAVKLLPGIDPTAAETVDVGGVSAIWVKGPDMLYADKNGWIVSTNTSKKGDRLAMSKALMEKMFTRLPQAPE